MYRYLTHLLRACESGVTSEQIVDTMYACVLQEEAIPETSLLDNPNQQMCDTEASDLEKPLEDISPMMFDEDTNLGQPASGIK